MTMPNGNGRENSPHESVIGRNELKGEGYGEITAVDLEGGTLDSQAAR